MLRVSDSARSRASEAKTIPTVGQDRPSNQFFLGCIATAITMTCTSHRQLSVCCCGAELPGPQRDAVALRPAAHCNTVKALHEDGDRWDAPCIGVARQQRSEGKRAKKMWGYAEGGQSGAMDREFCNRSDCKPSEDP